MQVNVSKKFTHKVMGKNNNNNNAMDKCQLVNMGACIYIE